MEYSGFSLRILYFLRENQPSKTSLADLLKHINSLFGWRNGEGKFPGHSGDGILGYCLFLLTNRNFIEIFDKDGNNVSQETMKHKGNWGSIDSGYDIAYFLKGREEEIFISLTNKLNELQEILGYSLSKEIKEMDSVDSVSIKPFFGVPDNHLRTDVFVLMPFSKEFIPVFDDHILKVCMKLSKKCIRADNLFGSSTIMTDVWQLIFHSEFIISDCTGRNPNVFYELGIAHTLGKRVILITQNEDDIPFDIRHIRYIKYEYTPRGMKLFESNLQKYLTESK